MSAPDISIVVPTFERRASLSRLLAALGGQTFGGRFEALVVDDGSRDGTVEWLRGVQVPYDLRVITRAHAGPGAARNAGVAEARADLLLFLDDDVVPDNTLVAVHVAAHEATPNSVVIGPMLPPDNWGRPAWIRWEEQKLLAQYRAMQDRVYACTFRQFFTANASLGRHDFLRAGGFDTSFARAEDVDLGYRLYRSGLRFVFKPEARVWHYAERSFDDWRRTPYRYGQADVVMHREKGNPVLELVFHEFHRRHLLSRALARSCVGSPVLFPCANVALAGVVRVADRLALRGIAAGALSGLFNLLYWQGVSDTLGGPTKVWGAVAAARHRRAVPGFLT